MAHKLIYVRTDKNGTKIFHDYTCQRCGGLGGSDHWAYTGWTCYECGGSGQATKPDVIKEYTPEYRAKLDKMAEARAEKKRAKRAEEFKANLSTVLQDKGFNADGKLYLAIGNTYAIKDELRENGAKWKMALKGWSFTEKPEAYQTIELTADECLDFHFEHGWCEWKDESELTTLIAGKLPKEENPVSEYVGNIGERISTQVTLEHIFAYERCAYRGYGTEYVRIYKFRDDNGNVLVWNTTGFLKLQDGDKVTITGTVKEHSEYKGEKQTSLQRCKVS